MGLSSFKSGLGDSFCFGVVFFCFCFLFVYSLSVCICNDDLSVYDVHVSVSVYMCVRATECPEG